MKNKLTRTIATLLSLVLLLSCFAVPGMAAQQFTDVSDRAWYAGAVSYVESRGWMKGVGGGSFAPDSPVTRAMFATVLARYAGAELDGETTLFSDVPMNTWYTGSVTWAKTHGIVNGVGGSRFEPAAGISRQDLCTMLGRFLEMGGWELEKGSPRTFTDAAEISGYAQAAVELCASVGLINGFEDGSFRPFGISSRAQVAAILMRLDKLLGTDAGEEPGKPPVDLPEDQKPVSFEGQTGSGVIVRAEAAPGVLPGGAVLELKDVTAELQAKQPQTRGPGSLNYVAAVDISFTLDGQEVQPNGPVTVTMDRLPLVRGGAYQVFHVTEGGSLEHVCGIDTSLPVNDNVHFEATHFSVYAIIETDETSFQSGESVRRFYRFYSDAEGTVAYNFSTDENNQAINYQIVRNGDRLYHPGVPLTEGSSEFQGWKVLRVVNTTAVAAGDYLSFPNTEAGEDGASYRVTDPISGIAASASADEEVILVPAFSGILLTYMDELGSVIRTQQLSNGAVVQTAPESTELPYTPYTNSKKFMGWSVNQTEANPASYSPAPLTVNDSTTLYPVLADSFLLSFLPGPVGSGASYVSSIRMTATDSLTELPVPTRTGYAFQGWYVNGSETQVSNGDGQVLSAYNGGVLRLSADMSLEGRWSANDVTYTAVSWLQNPDDDGYSFLEMDEMQAAAGTPLGELGIPYQSYYESSYHCTLNAGKTTEANQDANQQDKTVAGDGSTIMNIYYDRNEYSLSFYWRDYEYRPTTETTGVYGKVGDEYYAIHLGTRSVPRQETYYATEYRWSVNGSSEYNGYCYKLRSDWKIGANDSDGKNNNHGLSLGYVAYRATGSSSGPYEVRFSRYKTLGFVSNDYYYWTTDSTYHDESIFGFYSSSNYKNIYTGNVYERVTKPSNPTYSTQTTDVYGWYNSAYKKLTPIAVQVQKTRTVYDTVDQWYYYNYDAATYTSAGTSDLTPSDLSTNEFYTTTGTLYYLNSDDEYVAVKYSQTYADNPNFGSGWYYTKGTTNYILASGVTLYTPPLSQTSAYYYNSTPYKYDLYYDEIPPITITARWGANIADQWPSEVDPDSYPAAWYDYESFNNLTSKKLTMPAMDDEYAYSHQTFGTEQYVWERRVYLQNLDGTYPSQRDANYSTSQPRATHGIWTNFGPAIAGFTYDESDLTEERSGSSGLWKFTTDDESSPIVDSENGYHRVFYFDDYYIRNSYNLVFHANGGSAVPTQSILFEDTLTEQEPASYEIGTTTKVQDGITYIFQGWFSNQALAGEPFDFENETMPANTLNLYAKWIAQEYLVQLDFNGGETKGNDRTYFWASSGKTISEYRDVERNYVELSADDSYSGTVYRYHHNFYQDGTTGWHSPRKAYYYDEGSGHTHSSDPEEYETVKGETQRYRPVNAEQGEGFRLMGWYQVKDNDLFNGAAERYPADFTQAIDALVTDGTLTLRAEWQTTGRYTVDFPGLTNKGRTYVDLSQIVIPGEPTTRPENVDPGAHFLGWVGPDGELYYPGDVYTIRASDAEKIERDSQTVYELGFTPAYGELPHTVLILDGNGGVTETNAAATSTVNVPMNQKLTLPGADAFTKDGCFLIGWNSSKDAADAGTVQYALGERIAVNGLSTETAGTQNKLYAVWEKRDFFYVVHSSDGSIDAVPFVAGEKPDLTKLVKAGYRYGGAYTAYGTGDGLKVRQSEVETAAASIYTGSARMGSSPVWSAATVDSLGQVFRTETKPAAVTKFETYGLSSSPAEFWVRANSVSASPDSFQAEKAEIYYLKEIPAGYLGDYVLYVYDAAQDNAIQYAYLISAIDDTNYANRWMMMDSTDYTASIYSSLSYQINGQTGTTTVSVRELFGESLPGTAKLLVSRKIDKANLTGGATVTVQPKINTRDGFVTLGAEEQETIPEGLKVTTNGLGAQPNGRLIQLPGTSALSPNGTEPNGTAGAGTAAPDGSTSLDGDGLETLILELEESQGLYLVPLTGPQED